MGFFKRLLGGGAAPPTPVRPVPQNRPGSTITFIPTETVVEFDPDGWAESLSPEDARLTWRTSSADGKVTIDIVGESFRQGNIKQVQAHYGDKWFPIYLVHDADNPHDKNAVAVYTGNAQVGFIDKDDARIWVKYVKEAAKARQVIAGEANCKTDASMQGSYWGVFGYVWFGRMIAPNFAAADAKRLTPAALAKAMDRLTTLVAEVEEPETAAQARSVGKKAGKAALPLYAHAVWMVENDDPARSQWEEVIDLGDTLFDECDENAFTTGEDIDGDVIGAMEAFAEAVGDAMTAGGAN